MCGLREGTLPGVDLLSLWRLSGLPVDFAILFGPGLIPITLTIFFDYVALLPIFNRANTMPIGRRVSYFITCATSLETALLMKSFIVVPAAVAA